MTDWDGEQYDQFKQQRQQAGADLLHAIPQIDAIEIIDAGCGTGYLTAQLEQRWPKAKIKAFDPSASMLAKAKSRSSTIQWHQLDLHHWLDQDEQVDIIFCNAVLHWLPAHEALLTQLMQRLKPNGWLALQMPDNQNAIFQQAIQTCLQIFPDQAALPSVGIYPSQKQASEYIEYLTAKTQNLRVWHTLYYHLLKGENPIFDWLQGAALRPLCKVLSSEDMTRFKNHYQSVIAAHYPQNAQGFTVLPFQRLFILAQAQG